MQLCNINYTPLNDSTQNDYSLMHLKKYRLDFKHKKNAIENSIALCRNIRKDY